MGLLARTLTSVLAVALLAAALAGPAEARTAVVRVETPQSSPSPVVARTSVATPGSPLTVTDPTTPANTATCQPTSALAALDAVVGHANWSATVDGAGAVTLTKIKNSTWPLFVPPATQTWAWKTYVDEQPVTDPCHADVPDGSEALFFPSCTKPTPMVQATCYTGGALYLKINQGGPYDVAPALVPPLNSPVTAQVDLAENGSISPTMGASLSTDENYSSTTADDQTLRGLAALNFFAGGPHSVLVTQAGKVPVEGAVCATQGADGFCGTTKAPTNDIPPVDAPCTTNGHDGNCGTTDTTGPTTHVTNITDKQVFKKKKGPGQIKGTIDADPNGQKAVQIRLTRTWTTRVKVRVKTKSKSKKKRYRYKTVKRCAYWNDSTALLETVKCGTKAAAGRFYQADLGDLRLDFTLDFALTLPTGSYKLEVRAQDENGFQDPVELGRNVLTFAVQ